MRWRETLVHLFICIVCLMCLASGAGRTTTRPLPRFATTLPTICPFKLMIHAALVRLVYVDDVINDFLRLLNERPAGVVRPEVSPVYTITVGELAEQIRMFKGGRESMVTEAVGTGLTRALYATYLSFLRPEQFSYSLTAHADKRGRFVEMLKTKDSGPVFIFHRASGNYARRALSPYQERKVSGDPG